MDDFSHSSPLTHEKLSSMSTAQEGGGPQSSKRMSNRSTTKPCVVHSHSLDAPLDSHAEQERERACACVLACVCARVRGRERPASRNALAVSGEGVQTA